MVTEGSSLRHRLVVTNAPPPSGTEDSTSSSQQERTFIEICTPDDPAKVSQVCAEKPVDMPTLDNEGGMSTCEGGVPTYEGDGDADRHATLDERGVATGEVLEEGQVLAGEEKEEVKWGVEVDSVEVESVKGDVKSSVQEEEKHWSFPPVLEEFNLMDSDVDPCDLDEIFADSR